MDYEKIVKTIIDPIVEDSNSVLLRVNEEEKDVLIIIAAEKDDTARLIGRKGIIANAIREVVSVAGKSEEKHVHLKFESFDDGTDSFSLSMIDTLDIEDVYDDKVLANDIYEAYSLLKDKYKEVIELYFGMLDGKQYTVKEIAEILNKSPNQVRWLVEKGVLNIRKILEGFGYDNETMAKTYQNRLKLPKK